MSLTVAQLLPALEEGGVERATVEVAEALVEAGHRAIVISAGGRLVERLEAVGAEHVALPIGVKSPLTLGRVGRLRRLFASWPADVIHARSRLPAWIGFLAWRGMPSGGRPAFVTTMHGVHRVNRYSEIMTRGERVIAVSEYVRDYILRSFPGVARTRIRVIPEGVDPARFPHGHRPSDRWLRDWHGAFPRLADAGAVVTLAARLTRRKGHEDFIRMLAAAGRVRPELHGVIVGDGGNRGSRYRAELDRLARDLDVRGRLTFVGGRDDLREILAYSNVVASLSSRPEAFGRVTLEALSLGTPVVGYGHGGTAEVLRAVYPEGLVEAGNPAAAASKLVQLLETPVRVPERHGFPLSRTLAETLSLYQTLAAGRRDGGAP